MNTRGKFSVLFVALGLVLLIVGLAAGSERLPFAGLLLVAVSLRYRKNAAAWEYLCFLALALVLLALRLPNSPVLGAVPLMLSYVLDYLDERRQKRSMAANAPRSRHAPTLN